MACRTRALGRPTAARSSRTAILALLAGLVAVAIAGCGGVSASVGSGKTLVLYSAQHPETTSAIIAAFTRQTGIKVLVKNDSEDVLTAQLEQEGSRSPADVFYTENSNWLQQLDDRGLLAKVAGATLANTPRRDSATNGDWLGVSGRFSGLIYNPSKVRAAQLPKTALALASPRYKGMLELAPAETDFWPIITSIARAHGRSRRAELAQGAEGQRGIQRQHRRTTRPWSAT